MVEPRARAASEATGLGPAVRVRTTGVADIVADRTFDEAVGLPTGRQDVHEPLSGAA